MEKILRIIIVLLIVMVTSCKKETSKITNKEDVKKIEIDFFSNAINKTTIKLTYNWVVVLPGLGCHGCIQEGEAFMKEYVSKKDILFVLTNIESLKILQKKIGIKIKEHSNIYIDRDNLFGIRTDNRIYPCIIQMKEGKLKQHEFQSPRNGGAFEKLESKY